MGGVRHHTVRVLSKLQVEVALGLRWEASRIIGAMDLSVVFHLIGLAFYCHLL